MSLMDELQAQDAATHSPPSEPSTPDPLLAHVDALTAAINDLTAQQNEVSMNMRLLEESITERSAPESSPSVDVRRELHGLDETLKKLADNISGEDLKLAVGEAVSSARADTAKASKAAAVKVDTALGDLRRDLPKSMKAAAREISVSAPPPRIDAAALSDAVARRLRSGVVEPIEARAAALVAAALVGLGALVALGYRAALTVTLTPVWSSLGWWLTALLTVSATLVAVAAVYVAVRTLLGRVAAWWRREPWRALSSLPAGFRDRWANLRTNLRR